VRAERLQDISDSDVEAEGVTFPYGAVIDRVGLSRACGLNHFRPLWDSINGKKQAWPHGEMASTNSWNANPWVWVVEFKRVEDHA
jgi:hypothetical protein